MEKYNYLKWQEFYNNTYISKYNNIKELIGTNTLLQDELFKKFVDIFYLSCELLKLYLANNGWFYDTPKRVIRYAFRAQILDDAEDFIIIENMFDLYRKKQLQMEYIINYGLKEHFYIIDNLKNKFVNLLGENG